MAISWVTSAIAYLRAGASTYTTLIEFQLVLSILFIALAYLADTDRRRKREP